MPDATRLVDQSCENCLYWYTSVSAALSLDTGACRRYPPTPQPNTGLPEHLFVEPSDWCGEWKERIDD